MEWRELCKRKISSTTPNCSHIASVSPQSTDAAPAAELTSKDEGREVSKALLLLLTFFGGGLGAHKFYLGKYWQGALYLLFFWTLIPALIALIEFIVYAFTGAERLNEKYSAHGALAVIALLIRHVREPLEALFRAHGLAAIGSDPLADVILAQNQHAAAEGEELRPRRRYVVWGDKVSAS